MDAVDNKYWETLKIPLEAEPQSSSFLCMQNNVGNDLLAIYRNDIEVAEKLTQLEVI